MTAHIPYGYRIVDGKAVVDEVQEEQVRSFFEEYISGKALKVAAENMGLFIAKVKYRKLQPPFVGNCRINGWGKCRF